MKKLLLLVIILLGVGFVAIQNINSQAENNSKESTQENIQIKQNKEISSEKSQLISDVSKSVFVPYWNIDDTENLAEYDSVIYFGISVNENGVNREDQGFANLQKFVDSTNDSKQYLTVRMLNTETNLAILESNEAQKQVIADVISVANEYGFEGVVLDLELSVIPFSNVKDNISLFISLFSDELQLQDLAFDVTLYGDTYYRGRPYDVEKIASKVDNILIMAYDFHKSRGEPGPNFPFSGQKIYGYDFQQMISDFTKDVPSEKITVIFGMFGYDWTLGSQGLPLTSATAFTLADAQEGFIPTCEYSACNVIRDTESKEMKGSYIDDEDYKHEIWFEDEESVDIKTNYLKEQGIGAISYWTWGYW